MHYKQTTNKLETLTVITSPFFLIMLEDISVLEEYSQQGLGARFAVQFGKAFFSEKAAENQQLSSDLDVKSLNVKAGSRTKKPPVDTK